MVEMRPLASQGCSLKGAINSICFGATNANDISGISPSASADAIKRCGCQVAAASA